MRIFHVWQRLQFFNEDLKEERKRTQIYKSESIEKSSDFENWVFRELKEKEAYIEKKNFNNNTIRKYFFKEVIYSSKNLG